MCLDFENMALEWGIGKIEHMSFAWFCIFKLKTFQDLELRTNITPCHYIIESNKKAIK